MTKLFTINVFLVMMLIAASARGEIAFDVYESDVDREILTLDLLQSRAGKLIPVHVYTCCLSERRMRALAEAGTREKQEYRVASQDKESKLFSEFPPSANLDFFGQQFIPVVVDDSNLVLPILPLKLDHTFSVIGYDVDTQEVTHRVFELNADGGVVDQVMVNQSIGGANCS